MGVELDEVVYGSVTKKDGAYTPTIRLLCYELLMNGQDANKVNPDT